MRKIIFYFLALFLLLSCQSSDLNHLEVFSPDKNISFKAFLKSNETDNTDSRQLFYTVSFKNEIIIEASALGMEFKNMSPLGKGLKIRSKETNIVKESWERVWGRRKQVQNNYSELVIAFEEIQEPKRVFDLVVRAYDDGVAFRHKFPEQKKLKDFSITRENTTFNFTEDHTVWAANYGGYASHQESEYEEMKLSTIDTNIIGLPLLVKAGQERWLSITEAELTDWAGMYLSGLPDSKNGICTKLSPRPDEPDVLVKSSAPRQSPWRVIMISESAGDFMASDLIANLNEPCALEDVSWIKPGKSAWDWWWCNFYAPDAGFKLGSNNETMQYFIDFASEMGWEYQLVDWHWYGAPFINDENNNFVSNPEGDITTQNPDIDIPHLVEYAKSKNIKLLLWLEWEHADKQMDEAFPLYEKWGVAGVKVDFMARDDQYVVNYYHQLVKKAAEHHLVVDFHGAYKPTGFSRTYPNLMTREGVLGNEYTKWSNRITPEHNVTLPFTRGSLGEMDFTPGAFVHVTQENFKTEKEAPSPMVMGTRCHQLAMMVVYESALQVLCDSPDNYRKSPQGLEFINKVPTTWDETLVINADVANYITVARKSGEEWYIGSMTDWDERTLEIPLVFLDEGKYIAQIWRDAEDANTRPANAVAEKMEVDNKSVLPAKLAKGGGHVVHLVRK